MTDLPPDFERRYFRCDPLSVPVMKVSDCRAKRKLPLGLRKTTTGVPAGGAVMPLACRDCELAADLEDGKAPTRTLEEVCKARGNQPPPPLPPRKEKPRSHPAAKMPEGRIHEKASPAPAAKPANQLSRDTVSGYPPNLRSDTAGRGKEPDEPRGAGRDSPTPPPEENAMEGQPFKPITQKQRAFDYIAEHGPSTCNDICAALGLETLSLSSMLSVAARKGDLVWKHDENHVNRRRYSIPGRNPLADPGKEKSAPPETSQVQALAIRPQDKPGQLVKRIQRDPENAVRMNLEAGRLSLLRALEAHIEAGGDGTAEMLLRNFQGADRALDAYREGRA